MVRYEMMWGKIVVELAQDRRTCRAISNQFCPYFSNLNIVFVETFPRTSEKLLPRIFEWFKVKKNNFVYE